MLFQALWVTSCCGQCSEPGVPGKLRAVVRRAQENTLVLASVAGEVKGEQSRADHVADSSCLPFVFFPGLLPVTAGTSKKFCVTGALLDVHTVRSANISSL